MLSTLHYRNLQILQSAMRCLHVFLIVIFLTFPTSNCSHDYYEECSHLGSCGNFSNIGYPFWGNELKRPKSCGILGLQLKCNPSNDYPSLKLGQDEYQLVSMSSNFSIALKLQNHKPKYKNCIFIAINKSLDDNTSTSGTNISLYECQEPIKGDLDTDIHFSCKDNHGYQATYYLPSNLTDSDEKYQSCISIQITISSENLRGNRTPQNMLSGFQMGFLKESKDCRKCEDSGGMCGSSEDSPFPFVCYRKDGYQPHKNVYRKSGKLKLILEIVIPVGSLFFILASLLFGLFYYKMQKVTSAASSLSRTISYDRMRSDLQIGNSFFGVSIFSYNELQEATNNFDPARELGDGGFGVVYYGKLRDGREVAVKRLYERSYKQVEQFRNEVDILTKISHPNLVTLYGCTSRHSRELLLVYEYISNGTVASHLYGDRSESKSLTWTIRMKIAIQTAGALSYLHASDVIHCDVKTNNILLDSNFTVKVADFGLSRFFPFDVTHISTCPHGTPGYLDPDYDKCYQVTNKSDVYSFGVVLIELISSLPAIDVNRDKDNINLSTFAMNKIQQGKLCELVDQELGFESDFKVKRTVSLVAELAFQCVQQEKGVRPSMEEILEVLQQIDSVDYGELEAAEEMTPGFLISKPASVAAENEGLHQNL